MALANFGDLKSAVADWLLRSDLTARIPDFVKLAEAEIKRLVRRKTVRATLAVSTESTTLPADLAELRSIYPESGSPWQDAPLQIGTPEQVAEVRARHAAVSGRPLIGTVVDGALVVAPTPSQAYTYRITYFQALTALAADGDVNPILTEAPDIYLYGTLKHAAPFLEHDDRIATWQGLFSDAVEQLNDRRVREETAASLRKARLPAVF